MIEEVSVVGVTRMEERGKWGHIPERFAQFVINRRGVRSLDGSVAVFVFEGRAELAELKDKYFETAAGLTVGEMELVKQWVGTTPDKRVVLALALHTSSQKLYDSDIEQTWLVAGYVECECDENHLKVVPEGGAQEGEIACGTCGLAFDDLPDARLENVEEAGVPYDPRLLEFAGNSYR